MEDEEAAAYCCQCSWVTVRAERGVITTTLADIALFKSDGGDSEKVVPFATELPKLTGDLRRPPLWCCVGHRDPKF